MRLTMRNVTEEVIKNRGKSMTNPMLLMNMMVSAKANPMTLMKMMMSTKADPMMMSMMTKMMITGKMTMNFHM